MRGVHMTTPTTYVFGAIVQNADAGNASYNALQTTITKRFSHGFSFLGSYVWAKSLDISSIDPANITLTLSDQSNISRDRAPSDYDIPHVFVASYIWNTPRITNLAGVRQIRCKRLAIQRHHYSSQRHTIQCDLWSGLESRRHWHRSSQ